MNRTTLEIHCPKCGHPTEGQVGYDKITCASCGEVTATWDQESSYYRLTSEDNNLLADE